MPDTKLNFKNADTIRMMPLDAAGLFPPFGRPVADYLRGLVGNQNGTRALLKPGASDFSPVIRWSASTAPALRTTGFDQAERAGLAEPAPPEEVSDPRVADFLRIEQPGVAARDLNQTRIAIAVPDFWPVSLPRVSALPMRQRMMFGPAPAGRSKLASAPAPKPAAAPSAKSAPAVVPPAKPAVAQPAKPAAPAPPPPPKVVSPTPVPTKTVTAIPLVTKPAVTAPASPRVAPPQTPPPASPKIGPPPAAAARAPEAPVIASPSPAPKPPASPAARSAEAPAPSKPVQATRVSTIDKPAPPPVKPAPVAPPAAKAPATPPAGPKTPAPPMPSGRSSSPSPLAAAARDTLQQEAPKQKEPEARSRPVADTPRPPARAESIPAAINEPHLSMGADAESGSFLDKIPMVARIAIAILILMVGGYFAFSSSGDKAKPIDPIAAAGENSWSPFEWASDAPGSRRARQMQFYRPSRGMSDYQMQFVGQIESKALGWVFRASDTKNYYAMKIENVNPGSMALTHFAVVEGRESSYSQRPLSIDARPGAAYRVKLDVSGPRFTVYIGGEPVDFWTDNRLKSGAFGFMTERDERGATSSVQFSYPKGQ